MFYAKLALGNLRKNQRAYLPFLVSMLFLVAVNTLTQIIVKNPGMRKLPSFMSAMTMFNFGMVIILIFSVIFSLYTNSFLLKQRKKELGLYNVLGLGKRELYKLMAWETGFSFIFVTGVGLLVGIVLGKLSFLILKKLMNSDTGFVFQVPLAGIGFVALVFAIIFFLLFLVNCLQILRTDPIQLLHGGKVGEKMPKSRRLLAVLGGLFVGMGYFLALRIESPISALLWFFVAVILVIAGTYLLFIAGSITFLKWLKKRPNYYYQTDHFINISNMIYRMKQNAAGLASICILSTMVLVTVTTTASLYFGQQNTLDSRYPTDIMLTAEHQSVELFTAVAQLAEKEDITLSKGYQYTRTNGLLFANQAAGKWSVVNQKQDDAYNIPTATMVTFLDLADYQQLTGRQMTLAKDEALVLAQKGPTNFKHLKLGEATFKVKDFIPEFADFKKSEGVTDTYVVVLQDWEKTIQPLLDSWYQQADFAAYRRPQAVWDFDFSEKDLAKRHTFGVQVQQLVRQNFGSSTEGFTGESKDAQRKSTMAFTGGFFFLGIIFGITFTLATALIIYYKQVSEGLDDQECFDILQKVGMSHQEVKKVISSQILMIFAFPLLVAVIHLAFAFNMIRKLLLLFGLTNWHLFLGVTLVAVVIFALLYYLVYKLTAKSYYRIVER